MTATPAREVRWRLLLLLLLGSAVAYALVWTLAAEVLAWLAVVTFLTAAAFLAWLFLWSRLPRRRQGALLVAVVLALAALAAVVRIRGYRGDTRPEFGWRFAAAPEVPAAVTAARADLHGTTPFDAPQFLGPRRDGHYPSELTAARVTQAPQELWRQPVGEGFSSFAVVGEFAVTQMQEGDEEVVACFHWPTGKVYWMHADRARYSSSLGGTGPRATPTVHEGRVYTMGATGLLNCLDGATGAVLWSHDVCAENGGAPPAWGKSDSPLVVGDSVVVSTGGPDAALTAYDRVTGGRRWAAGSGACAYSSPLLGSVEGVPQIVIVHQSSLAGHDATSGAVLWTIPWHQGEAVAQPLLLAGSRVLHSRGYGGGAAAWDLRRQGDEWSAEEAWANRAVLKTKFTSPVLYEGSLYALSDGMTFDCVDPGTGERRYRERVDFGHGQLIAAGELFLVQTESGEIVWLQPDPAVYREIGRFAVFEDRTWNVPVVSGDHLLVRNHREAACFRFPGE